MTITQTEQETSEWESFRNEIEQELEQSKRELKEITLMLDQSQLEVNKLAQRSASITAHLQHVQAQIDSLPRADIRTAYESALDAQQRLFVMRGQLEKLQADQARLNKYHQLIERTLKVLEGGQPSQPLLRSGTTGQTVEMLVQAQEAERQRLSRQMHDGPAQALSNFILQTEIAMRLFDIDQDKARKELEDLKQSATTTFQKVRDFIFDLRPMMLDDLGLAPTSKRYVDVLKEQSGADLRLVVTGIERRLEPYLEVMVFRALQELLNNSVREGQATQVRLQIDMGETNLKVTCEDNGKGFDMARLEEPAFMGLKVIKDRVEMLGGFMEIHSLIGQGTEITFQIPITGKAG